MISNNIKEPYGAQNQKDHIETRRLHLVRSKSDQIWMRTKELLNPKVTLSSIRGVIFEVPQI